MLVTAMEKENAIQQYKHMARLHAPGRLIFVSAEAGSQEIGIIISAQ